MDPNWIENLNSVLDENKILTLANGDRLNMASGVKLIFEPQNVDNASPATVSRCGMVYMSSSALDWQPLLASWLMKKVKDKVMSIKIKQLFECSFNKVYKWTMNNLSLITAGLQIHILQTVFTLLEAMLPGLRPAKDKAKSKARNWERDREEEEVEEDSEEEELTSTNCDVHQTYIFALIWAFGGYLENEERVRLEAFLREKIQLQFPHLARGESIYNFSVSPITGKWQHWNTQMQSFVPPEISPQSYGHLLIPNVASIRSRLVHSHWSRSAKTVL